jgi:hypothetical protein
MISKATPRGHTTCRGVSPALFRSMKARVWRPKNRNLITSESEEALRSSVARRKSAPSLVRGTRTASGARSTKNCTISIGVNVAQAEWSGSSLSWLRAVSDDSGFHRDEQHPSICWAQLLVIRWKYEVSSSITLKCAGSNVCYRTLDVWGKIVFDLNHHTVDSYRWISSVGRNFKL